METVITKQLKFRNAIKRFFKTELIKSYVKFIKKNKIKLREQIKIKKNRGEIVGKV